MRRLRSARFRRYVSSGSGSAAALTFAHSSRRSLSEPRTAAPSKLASAVGSAAAASLTAAACSGDSDPDRAASFVASSAVGRLAVSNASRARPTDVPIVLAKCSSAERSPALRHSPVSAMRLARSASIVAAAFFSTVTSASMRWASLRASAPGASARDAAVTRSRMSAISSRPTTAQALPGRGAHVERIEGATTRAGWLRSRPPPTATEDVGANMIETRTYARNPNFRMSGSPTERRGRRSTERLEHS